MAITRDLKSFFSIKDNWKITISMIVYGIAQGILRPMNAIYLKDAIHLSKLEITLLMCISLLFDMCVTFFMGLYSDKIRHKKIIPLVSSLLCVIGFLLYLHADSFWTALVGMIVATSPAGIIMGQMFAMARNHYTKEANNIIEMALVWLRAIYSFGFFLGLLCGAEIFTIVSFRGVLIGNLICYIILFCALFFYRERTEFAEPNRKSAVPFEWIVIISFLLLLCADAVRGLYFPLMVDSLFHSPALVSRLWSLQAIFELLWMTIAGYLASKFGSVRIVQCGAVCGLAVYLVYALHPSLTLLIIVQPIHSFYISTLLSIAMGHVQRMFLHKMGFGSSLYLVLTQTASLIGYLLPNVVTGFSPAIFFIPAGLALISIVTLSIRTMNFKLEQSP